MATALVGAMTYFEGAMVASLITLGSVEVHVPG